MAKCALCSNHYILADLFCSQSFRGANSLCETHDYTDLYCIPCLIDLGLVDKEGCFSHDITYQDVQEVTGSLSAKLLRDYHRREGNRKNMLTAMYISLAGCAFGRIVGSEPLLTFFFLVFILLAIVGPRLK